MRASGSGGLVIRVRDRDEHESCESETPSSKIMDLHGWLSRASGTTWTTHLPY